MTHKEALKRALKELIQARINLDHGQKNGVPPEQMAALREKVEYRETVVEALRPMPHGEPLTLEQLREMDGKPVWVKVISGTDISGDGWCEVEVKHENTSAEIAYVWWPGSEVQDIGRINGYGKTWLAYAYPPAHIDREAWDECEYCDDCASCRNASLPGWDHICSACVVGVQDSYEPMNFCPECGRPLTEEGWAMLEKRLNGGERSE